MASESRTQRLRAPLVGLAALALLTLLCVWLLRSSAPPPEMPDAREEAVAVPPAAPRAAAETIAVDYSPDGVPIHPPGNANIDARGMLPHPITPQHERIFRENNLIGDLNGAMDVKDSAGLRRLLAQYRDEYPEDAHVLQRGYELIADCMESPGPETRAVAQRYYDEELDSGLRRYIRRYCLE
ncbi:MAG TPA: hypothetical protein VHB79_16420 [Polyangiaceae bacterium]|nr:hypothetical protein [Polyangiaceae bacterium]